MSIITRFREDIRAAKAGDPAARGALSIALVYSGLHAVWWHRLSHRLWNRGMRFLPRAISQLVRGATGIEITPRLREAGAHVLVVSGFDLDAVVLGALAAGADGYLVKSEDPARLVEAVRAVHRGDAVLSPAATRTVVAALRGRGDGTPGPGAAAGGERDSSRTDSGQEDSGHG